MPICYSRAYYMPRALMITTAMLVHPHMRSSSAFAAARAGLALARLASALLRAMLLPAF